MKKMKWIMIIAAAAIVVLGCVLFIIKKGTSNYGGVLDGDGMINPYAISLFSYYSGGGMENGHYRVTLENNELSVERRTGEKTDSKKYIVPDDTVNEIEKVLYDSGMKKRHGDFTAGEFIALDADTVSVIVDYADGAHIEFDSNQEVPEEFWDAVNETMLLLEEIADK